MTSSTTAVVEFPTPEAAEECLDRGVFSWDLGTESHVFNVERFGKKPFYFSTLKHMTLMICKIPRKHTTSKAFSGSIRN